MLHTYTSMLCGRRMAGRAVGSILSSLCIPLTQLPSPRLASTLGALITVL